MARLDGPRRRLGGPHHVRTRPFVGPRRGVQAVARSPRASARGRPGRTPPRRCGARYRSWVCRMGRLRSASSPQRCASRLPEIAPTLVDLVQAPLPALADQGLDKHRGSRRIVVLQGWNLVGDGMGVWHATNVTFFQQLHKRCNTSARVRGEEFPQRLGGNRWPLWPPSSTVTSTTLRSSAHPAVDVVTGPLVVTAGAAALIDVAPERIQPGPAGR